MNAPEGPATDQPLEASPAELEETVTEMTHFFYEGHIEAAARGYHAVAHVIPHLEQYRGTWQPLGYQSFTHGEVFGNGSRGALHMWPPHLRLADILSPGEQPLQIAQGNYDPEAVKESRLWQREYGGEHHKKFANGHIHDHTQDMVSITLIGDNEDALIVQSPYTQERLETGVDERTIAKDAVGQVYMVHYLDTGPRHPDDPEAAAKKTGILATDGERSYSYYNQMRVRGHGSGTFTPAGVEHIQLIPKEGAVATYAIKSAPKLNGPFVVVDSIEAYLASPSLLVSEEESVYTKIAMFARVLKEHRDLIVTNPAIREGWNNLSSADRASASTMTETKMKAWADELIAVRQQEQLSAKQSLGEYMGKLVAANQLHILAAPPISTPESELRARAAMLRGPAVSLTNRILATIPEASNTIPVLGELSAQEYEYHLQAEKPVQPYASASRLHKLTQL